MTYGFEIYKADGTKQMSSEDRHFVLIDSFEITATSQGTKNYPGYSNSRVIALAIRAEPSSVPGYTFDINNTWQIYPYGPYGYGHYIYVSGTSSEAIVNWEYPAYRYYQSGYFYNGTKQPTSSSTVYVYAI